MPKLRCSNESCRDHPTTPLFKIENAVVLCDENLTVSLLDLERSIKPRAWEYHDVRFLCDHCLSDAEIEGEDNAEAA